MKNLKGFTLIELLIVILIISIVAGIATVTISTNKNKQYETIGKQLVNTINLAEQEAMLRPATLGLAFTPDSFQFFVFQTDRKTRQNTWQAMTNASLGLHRIPNDTQITVKILGETIPADGQPKIIISPSNDLTPFIILIGKHTETPYYQVIGKANGEVTSERFVAK
ncbi:MAG: type II secretion system minor pseudopilin GspH [Gammaproteobacteria bacterium]